MQYQVQPGLYQHYKGMEYQVIDVVTHSETEEVLVLYRALYGAHGLWVRPIAMFCDHVERDGQRLPRFAYQGPISTLDQ